MPQGQVAVRIDYNLYSFKKAMHEYCLFSFQNSRPFCVDCKSEFSLRPILKSKTPSHRYIYSFKYDRHYSDLCKLESRQLLGGEEKNRVLFSDLQIDPSLSPFMRCQLEIITSSSNYSELLDIIENKNIYSPGFKAEYLVLDGDEITYPDRLQKSRDIGYHIGGKPDFKKPSILYSLCHHEGIWYFATLTRHDKDWHKHRKKPCTFSNSIGINIAKSLVALASKGNTSSQLLDACCGVGTVMLEACISRFQIDGNDINWKAYRHARENLAHFKYTNEVSCSDIKDLEKTYDGVIIDLPYNMYSLSTDDIALSIIESAAKLASRVVIVSVADIESMINSSGLKVIDFCTVEKRGHSTFTRRIWVCERTN